MPLATIASAISLINCSLTLQANLFQLFQPIGGVRARPLPTARALVRAPGSERVMTRLVDMSVAHRLSLQLGMASSVLSRYRNKVFHLWQVCFVMLMSIAFCGILDRASSFKAGGSANDQAFLYSQVGCAVGRGPDAALYGAPLTDRNDYPNDSFHKKAAPNRASW